MRRGVIVIVALMLTAGLGVGGYLLWRSSVAKAIRDAEETVRKMGGKVEYEDKRSTKPIVGIVLIKSQLVDREHLARLSRFPKLRSVHLALSSLSDDALDRLAAIAELDELYVDGTAVTDAGLKHLKSCTKLRWLGLGNTSVTDAGVAEVGGLTS